MMKKALIALLIAALSLSMLVAITGCGKDQNTEDAKAFMIEGDEYMDAAMEQQAILQEQQNQLQATIMGGDVSALTGEAGEAGKAAFGETLTEMDNDLDSADTAYSSILDLDGVQDYKDYASKMLEAIALYKQWSQAAEALLESITAMIAALPPGQVPDITMFQQLAELPEVQVITTAIDKAEKLVKEADQIKLDKSL